MKILISTDIEGVAGVVDPQQVRAGNPEYERARLWMTKEANAAILGAFEAGAEKVFVNDSHAGFRNIIVSELDPRAILITGKPRLYSMMSGIEFNVDGVALVGHHSQAQGRGVLAHTINSFAFAKISINGQSLGEPGLYGLLAAEKGIPLIFGSGDQYLAEENKAHFPEAIWVETKWAMGHTCAASKTIEASCEDIRKGMKEAVSRLQQNKSSLFSLKKPYVCTLQTTTPGLADLFCMLPNTNRVDGVTITFEQPSIEYIVRTLNVFSSMSASLR
ncbi:D-aminopeptidase [Pelistega indica]|uniref:D-aminopeptidase n=1 Tax=Pelistega indica TaxID=1414851 RepID=V8G8W6_9BURK|nr:MULTISPECIES: M55 family metallopeptidase [Pelistega]ETD72137.1 D-aminopeptidase [Pelistega indica]